MDGVGSGSEDRVDHFILACLDGCLDEKLFLDAHLLVFRGLDRLAVDIVGVV